MENLVLPAVTLAALGVSLAADRRKTAAALRRAAGKMEKIALPLLVMLVLVSLVLTFLSEERISAALSRDSLTLGMGLASLIGSVTMMPGFIAFPLAGVLRDNLVPYAVISAFTTTLMMVGVVTFPLEREILGLRTALLRNGLSLLIALAAALATGIVFGEIPGGG